MSCSREDNNRDAPTTRADSLEAWTLRRVGPRRQVQELALTSTRVVFRGAPNQPDPAHLAVVAMFTTADWTQPQIGGLLSEVRVRQRAPPKSSHESRRTP